MLKVEFLTNSSFNTVTFYHSEYFGKISGMSFEVLVLTLREMSDYMAVRNTGVEMWSKE
jgi:hypothetical protein